MSNDMYRRGRDLIWRRHWNKMSLFIVHRVNGHIDWDKTRASGRLIKQYQGQSQRSQR